MAEIILHHYEVSPFSEKPRVMLGVKGLAWRAVEQPVIMPKPDLVALTGGYRRIPVMQVGADIYCDTQVILAEIERRFPDPPVVGPGDWAVNLAADRLWFQASVTTIFSEMGEAVPKEFIADREKLSGRPFDVKGMKAAAPFMRTQWRAHAAWLEEGLAGGDFLGGSEPSLADIACYMNIWWTRRGARAAYDELTRGLTRLAAWRERMAAIGHGQVSPMTPAEALAVATAAMPDEPLPSDADDPSGFKVGDAVAVMADDYGRDPIQGRLLALTRDRVTLARECGELDVINVHFPRAGYVLARA
jgi:glutathione S-transferase